MICVLSACSWLLSWAKFKNTIIITLTIWRMGGFEDLQMLSLYLCCCSFIIYMASFLVWLLTLNTHSSRKQTRVLWTDWHLNPGYTTKESVVISALTITQSVHMPNRSFISTAYLHSLLGGQKCWVLWSSSSQG